MLPKNSSNHVIWTLAVIMVGVLFSIILVKAGSIIYAKAKEADLSNKKFGGLLVDYGFLTPKVPVEEENKDSRQASDFKNSSDISDDQGNPLLAVDPISLLEEDFYLQLGTSLRGEDGSLAISFVDRIHNVSSLPLESQDKNIYSPKSVSFSPDGKRVYVNSLEGFKTLVYDAESREPIDVIHHQYNNRYGKPVESAFSHEGKFLWVPYYRWSDDTLGSQPSAVAIINTSSNAIVKVLDTGLISKNIAISPASNFAAVTNWGENTVTLFNIKNDNAEGFTLNETLVIGKKINLASTTENPIDHDRFCGLCVRGVLFSPDESVLLVGMMGGGGIAGFDLATNEFMGIVNTAGLFPRDLTLTPDNETVYISSSDGSVKRVKINNLIDTLRASNKKTVSTPNIFETIGVGKLPRSIKISPDGKYAFVVLNSTSEIVVLNTETFKIVGKIRGDAFLVGLDISPDGKWLWTTSQGHSGKGGNSINIFSISKK